MKTSTLIVALCASVTGALPSYHWVNTTSIVNATGTVNATGIALNTTISANTTVNVPVPIYSNSTYGGGNLTYVGSNETHLPVLRRFRPVRKALYEAVLAGRN